MDWNTDLICHVLNRIRSFFAFIFNNFFGSETQEPYTEGYIWLTNQFGHFFIGFGGLFLLTWIASYASGRPVPSHAYEGQIVNRQGREPVTTRTIWFLVLAWFLIWMSKEWLYDYSRASQLAFYLVDPFFNDVFWDTATDSFFYTAGIVVALSHFGLVRPTPIPVFLSVFIIAVALATYWVPARQRLETAGTPYFIRLNSNDFELNVKFSRLSRTAFLDRIFRDEWAQSTGLEPAVRPGQLNPFQFLMEPQADRRQILVVGGTQLIPRFFIAIVNERIIRQPVSDKCDTRFITFRDLLNSRVKQTKDPGVIKWKIETVLHENTKLENPACPIEDAELLIVDQAPTIRVAATQIAALVAFVENETKPDVQPVCGVDLQDPEAAPDVAAAIRAIDPVEVQRKLEIFFSALSEKTVIWILDNDSVVRGWTRSLQRNFPHKSIGVIEFEAMR